MFAAKHTLSRAPHHNPYFGGGYYSFRKFQGFRTDDGCPQGEGSQFLVGRGIECLLRVIV